MGDPVGDSVKHRARSAGRSPSALWKPLVAVAGYCLFLLRGTCVAIADFWVLYRRVGKVYRQPRDYAPSIAAGDLVMQLASTSPTHSCVCVNDEVLHLNESFIDRELWKGLNDASTAPSVVVTGVSYGGIGFYTALHVILCGADVHGVVRSMEKAEEAAHMMRVAVARQRRLRKGRSAPGRVGRFLLHKCDMSDAVAVARLADTLFSDANLRVVVCNAGPMCTPLKLSPQHLEEQFATHHVGHSLLLLRLLQRRLAASRGGATVSTPHVAVDMSVTFGGGRDADGSVARNDAAWRSEAATTTTATYAGPRPPRWRLIIAASAAAATAQPTDRTTFQRWSSVEELSSSVSRFSGYANAKMCELLFSFAIARFVRSDRRLAAHCTVNVLHPGPIRSRVIPNSKLPLRWLLDGELAALFRMTPVIASLYVTDLCLSQRYGQTSGHFFRMGEDQTVYYASMIADPAKRRGPLRNSTLWPGIPGPSVALSQERQDWLWDASLAFFDAQGLLDTSCFRRQ